jgi:single-strand DNA-binding protein
MNKCIFTGRLTKDPEHTTTNSGISVCRFSIAANRAYTNANGEKEADFINIVAWRGLADNCAKYLYKGNKVAVSGALQNRSYDDKDGNKRFATEIVADEVEFLETKKEDGTKSVSVSGKSKSEVAAGGYTADADDDLPF